MNVNSIKINVIYVSGRSYRSILGILPIPSIVRTVGGATVGIRSITLGSMTRINLFLLSGMNYN